MGLVFTILFIVATYVSPASYFPELVAYRPSLVLGAFALFFSIPGILANKPWKLLQSYLWIGLLAMAAISQIVNGWFGGALNATNDFIIQGMVFFLVVANCSTINRLKLLSGIICAVFIWMIYVGSIAYWAQSHTSNFIIWQGVAEDSLGNAILLPRLRALGTVNDPNDFAQALAVCIALLFLWYKPKKRLTNICFVLLPAAYLFYGMVLTHSRGSLVALTVLLLVTLRKRLGTIGATILSGGAAVGLLVLGFTGGRAVGAAEGTDRMSAWGEGLMMFKQKPIFGVGYGAFTEHYQLTAHNSFVLCFTELGFLGYFCWLGMIVCGFLGLRWVIARNKPIALMKEEPSDAAMSMAAAYGGSGLALAQDPVTKDISDMDDDERRQFKQDRDLENAAGVVQAALIAFLTCAWFLSRSYVMTLYILLGMSASIVLMGMRRDPERLFVPLKKLVRFTVVAEFASIAFVYLLVRSGHVL